jgi:hypothetical protein
MMLARIKTIAAMGAGLAIMGLLVALIATRATLAETKLRFELWQTAVAHTQAEATADALTQKIEREAEYAKAATAAQSDYDALRERYARLVRTQAARHPAGRADLPGAARPAGIPQDAAENPELPSGAGDGIPFGTILIPQADALICAENTAYAQGAYGWAAGITPAR